MDNPIWLLVAIVVILVIVATVVVRRRPVDAFDVEVERPRPKGLIASGLSAIWRGGLGESAWESLEELLLSADVGVDPTTDVVDRIRSARPASVDEARHLLSTALEAQFLDADRNLTLGSRPSVVLVVGVNGSGKTTTIAKLAHFLTGQGQTVILGAADTFRAAAGQQLDAWARRVGVDLVRGEQGGDPASVAFDTVSSAKAKEIDVVIIDTAGRLHGKKNLMAELEKIHRVVSTEADVSEVLLVLDATSGQNGLAQVEQFGDAVPLTGIVLAKLDGTARGGIVVTVERTLGVPVKFVGLGEGLEDLRAFDPAAFVADLVEDQ